MSDEFWTFRARPDPDSDYRMGVLDGDTYDLVIDQGFNTLGTIRIRLRRVDTAEVFGSDGDEYEAGLKQRTFVREWFWTAVDGHDGDWPLRVTTTKGKGKFGRWLADIERRSDGAHLADAILDKYGEDYEY